MSDIDIVKDIVSDAKETMDAAEVLTAEMAELLVGNLRHVSNNNPKHRQLHWRRVDVLRALKRELNNFNSTTGEWK